MHIHCKIVINNVTHWRLKMYNYSCDVLSKECFIMFFYEAEDHSPWCPIAVYSHFYHIPLSLTFSTKFRYVCIREWVLHIFIIYAWKIPYFDNFPFAHRFNIGFSLVILQFSRFCQKCTKKVLLWRSTKKYDCLFFIWSRVCKNSKLSLPLA